MTNKFDLINQEASGLRAKGSELQPHIETEKVEDKMFSKDQLKTLWKLKERWHHLYTNLGSQKGKRRDELYDNLINVYIPNVLAAFPTLLNHINVKDEYIDYQNKRLIELERQRDKAYKKLGWTIAPYHDASEE